MSNRNARENKIRYEIQQNSDYPQSREDSRYKVFNQSFLNQLSENEQQIVAQYLTQAKQKSKRQLISQRDELLQQLHHINNHLSEMIDQLHGTISSLSQNKNANQQTNNQSKMSKKNKKPIINSNQSSPSKSIKQNTKDQPHNLNSNQLDFMEQKNNKLMISLQQQIQDYQFMLTGQYWDRLDQEITKQSIIKKQIQQEISYLTKTVQKHTKTYDKQIITKLQQSSYDKQVQLTFLIKKLQSKQNKLQSLESESRQKLYKTAKLQDQEISLTNILEMYEDEQYEGPESERKKKDKYEKLVLKKQKLQKVINSLNNNNLKSYNKKLSDFRQLQTQIQQYQQLSKKIDYNILILTKQRKQFHQRHKYLMNKSIVMQPNQGEFYKSQQATSESRYLSNKPKTQLFAKNRLKTYTHHPNQTSKKQQSDDQVFKKKRQQSVTYKNTLESKQQNSQRRRIYTELQNSHYFSSLGKNQQKQQKHQQKQKFPQKQRYQQKQRSSYYETPKYQTNQKSIFQGKNIIHQKNFNASVSNNSLKIEDQKLLRRKQQKDPFKQKSSRKGDSIERNVDNVDQIQERLRKLQNFLTRDQISISALEKIQKKLYSSKANKKQKINNQTFLSEPQKNLNKFKSKSHLTSQQKHYKQLCDSLGKNKLLIEQDVDIQGLIYQGISGKN